MADSQTPIAVWSLTAGTGPYQIAASLPGSLGLAATAPDGSTIPLYWVSDSAQCELCSGTLSNGQLTRNLIASTTGNLINWPAGGMRIIRTLAGGDGCASIYRVTGGTANTLASLLSCNTAIIWSSPAAGAKTQHIPAAANNDGRFLHIKLATGVTGTLTIIPAGGTVESQSSIAIEAPDNVMLLGDGAAGNWALL